MTAAIFSIESVDKIGRGQKYPPNLVHVVCSRGLIWVSQIPNSKNRSVWKPKFLANLELDDLLAIL